MSIYLDEYLLDIKRGNLMFGGSIGKMVFFLARGSIVIILNMLLNI